jgi:hypothetical protein
LTKDLKVRIPSLLAAFLHLAVFFLLVAGKVEVFGLKMGGKIENLLPLLVLAWFLDRKAYPIPFRELTALWIPGLFLIVSGLVIGFTMNPSTVALEELGRFGLQIATGIFLGAWIGGCLRSGSLWAVVWLVGLVVLQVRTPWHSLGHPALDGPFSHRNLQSAFYLLSFPVTLFAARTAGKGRSWGIQGLVSAILVSQAAFIAISKSRSGLLGVVIALGVAAWLAREHGWGSARKVWLPAAALACLALAIGMALFPRIKHIEAEFENPYVLSRSGIWSAAIEGFHEPVKWLVGTGMGDGYFWTIQESPMGNLNYRYRRGHHPHCLYLQWIYWGGILALIGWCQILRMIGASGRRSHASWEVCLLVACLLGFAGLEFVETTLRDPKVSVFFWLDLALLGCLSSTSERAVK